MPLVARLLPNTVDRALLLLSTSYQLRGRSAGTQPNDWYPAEAGAIWRIHARSFSCESNAATSIRSTIGFPSPTHRSSSSSISRTHRIRSAISGRSSLGLAVLGFGILRFQADGGGDAPPRRHWPRPGIGAPASSARHRSFCPLIGDTGSAGLARLRFPPALSSRPRPGADGRQPISCPHVRPSCVRGWRAGPPAARRF